jgi:hypothetical protein
VGGAESTPTLEEEPRFNADGVGAETKGIDVVFATVGGWFKQAESKEHVRAHADHERSGTATEMELLVLNLPIGLTA